MATTPSSQGSSPSSGPTTPASGTRRGRELLHAAVVVEFGARFVRTGFGSESTPRAVARAPWAAEAVEFRGVSYEKAAAAAERAVDEMAARIHRTPLKGHKVVLVDREDNHAYVREAGIRRLLFKHESEYVRVIPTSAAICAAAGSPFGIAVDVGFRDTRIVPVAFGSPLRDCATVLPIGVRGVLRRFQAMAHITGAEASPEYAACRGGMARAWDHALCVALARAASGGGGEEEQALPLCDGARVHVCPARAAAMVSAYFNGDVEDGSLPDAVTQALLRAPRDLRRPLARRIVLAGGGAAFPGVAVGLVRGLRDPERARIPRNEALAPVLAEASVVEPAAHPLARAWTGGACASRVALLGAPVYTKDLVAEAQPGILVDVDERPTAGLVACVDDATKDGAAVAAARPAASGTPDMGHRAVARQRLRLSSAGATPSPRVRRSSMS